MLPKRLSIIGVGLLGGSIGLAVKAARLDCTIVGYGHRRATLDRALEMGAIDEAVEDIAQAVTNAYFTILCTPVGLFRQNLSDLAAHLPSGSVITDVGSTKRSVVRDAEQILPKTVHFVGSHPMAGSDKRGNEFAQADLFRGATCIVTPTERTNGPALEQVETFWRALGMRIEALSPEEHDSRICDVSHLPHLLAAALVAMQDEKSLSLAGTGFLDVTRVAGGDGRLWSDILQDNRDSVTRSLARLRNTLDTAATLLEPAKAEELAAWLNATAKRREKLGELKVREIRPD